MKRFECIKILAGAFTDPLVITTAGGATHEWWNHGDNRGQLPARTLGLCSSVALGVAIAVPSHRVLALDGDGGLLMNSNTLITTSVHRPANLVHVCFDNGVYESSGGTPTFTQLGINLACVAKAAGIASTYEATTLDEFERAAVETAARSEHTFILARVEPGMDKVPPIAIGEVENKYRFVRYIESITGNPILRGPTSPVTKKDDDRGV